MKTFNLSAILMAISLLIGMSSCSENELYESGNSGAVTFNLQLQPQTTRSGGATFGLGIYATSLKCLVYDETGKYLTQTSTTLSDGQGSVNLNLVSGMSYKLLFWADSGTGYSPYTLNNSGEISVNLDKVQANSEYNDAFYAVKEFQAGTSTNENITLTRPFAQINFGTDDADMQLVAEAYPDGVYTTVTTNLYTRMNLLNGEVLDKQTYTTKLSTTASMTAESFPVAHKQAGKKYDYVNMLYAIVPAEGFTSDITLKTYKSSSEGADPTWTVNVPSAPIKQNWRTNIFGSLYTSDTNFNVIIDNHFINENDIDLGKIVVSSYDELRAAVKKANATPNTTILVDNDITFPTDSTITFSGSNTTLEILEGRNLSKSNGSTLFNIAEDALVTFSGKGNINCNMCGMFYIRGNLIINDGHYLSNTGVMTQLGKLTINGGYFKGADILFKYQTVEGAYTIINGGDFHANGTMFLYICC